MSLPNSELPSFPPCVPARLSFSQFMFTFCHVWQTISKISLHAHLNHNIAAHVPPGKDWA